MIEGGGSRNYVHTKKMMYCSPAVWDQLLGKLVAVVGEYAAEQVRAGADAIQIFDSWVGCLSVDDYRRYVLPSTRELVKCLQSTHAPIIYFGTDTAMLLPSMKETGAEAWPDRKSTRLNSSHVAISYAVFCLKKKSGRTI